MADIGIPKPVKLFVGILSSNKTLLEDVDILLEKRFGKIDIRSEIFPFDFTAYYKKEMGVNILRKFLSFKKLINPEEIPAIKIWTNKLEDKFKRNRKFNVIRPINFDPGYITHCNLILASTKDYYHRIHLQKGIYAEVTLFYQDKSFKNLPWTYPDYQTEEYKNFFLKVRTLYAKNISNN
ncbi:MAG: GTP-binding protein [Candidatus Scalindua rubra]|uniref:GTP-binding protein n=1 Tax=Candidatus Scalindua rubra TaxID=1872076 RepID=A0A1E3XAR3_9BACT|nr:MAG: GTP-binding protein [Candidatus Scalindua rubra]